MNYTEALEFLDNTPDFRVFRHHTLILDAMRTMRAQVQIPRAGSRPVAPPPAWQEQRPSTPVNPADYIRADIVRHLESRNRALIAALGPDYFSAADAIKDPGSSGLNELGQVLWDQAEWESEEMVRHMVRLKTLSPRFTHVGQALWELQMELRNSGDELAEEAAHTLFYLSPEKRGI